MVVKLTASMASTLAILVYTGSSVAMVILNKLIIARFFFDYPTVLLMFQMAAVLFGIELGRIVGIFKIGPYTFDKGKDVLCPSMLYSLHMYFSLTALEGMSLPIYGALKRFLPLLLCGASTAFLKKPAQSKRAFLGILLVSVGSAMASVYEWSLDGWSILYASFSLSLSVVYMSQFEKAAATTSYNCLEIIYLNAFNGLVFFLIADMVQDEIRDAFMYFLTSGSVLFWWCFTGVVGIGLVMNVSFLYCIHNISAVDTGMANSVKMAGQTAVTAMFSLFLLFDIQPSFYNLVGCTITGVGALIYCTERRKSGYTPLASSVPRKTLL